MIANWYKNLTTILQHSNVMNPDLTDPMLFRWAQIQEVQNQIKRDALESRPTLYCSLSEHQHNN